MIKSSFISLFLRKKWNINTNFGNTLSIAKSIMDEKLFLQFLAHYKTVYHDGQCLAPTWSGSVKGMSSSKLKKKM